MGAEVVLETMPLRPIVGQVLSEPSLASSLPPHVHRQEPGHILQTPHRPHSRESSGTSTRGRTLCLQAMSGVREAREGTKSQMRMFRPVPIKWAPAEIPDVLLVEAQPDIRDEPSKLNDDEWTLEAEDAHHRRECDICHGYRLHSGFQHPEQLHLVFRNDLPERDKDADLQSHLAMVLLTIEEGRTSEDDELDPVQAERDDI